MSTTNLGKLAVVLAAFRMLTVEPFLSARISSLETCHLSLNTKLVIKVPVSH